MNRLPELLAGFFIGMIANIIILYYQANIIAANNTCVITISIILLGCSLFCLYTPAIIVHFKKHSARVISVLSKIDVLANVISINLSFILIISITVNLISLSKGYNWIDYYTLSIGPILGAFGIGNMLIVDFILYRAMGKKYWYPNIYALIPIAFLIGAVWVIQLSPESKEHQSLIYLLSFAFGSCGFNFSLGYISGFFNKLFTDIITLFSNK